MKKVLSLLLIITLICSVCTVFAAAANTGEKSEDCIQCFLKPKEKKPEVTAAPENAPQATEKPKSNIPGTGRSNQPNANQPNANQPNANQPNANRPGQTLPEQNRPKPAPENPMSTLQKRFDALSEEQRKEIYKITDELNEKFIVLTGKYRELGLLSKQDADQITGVLKNGYEMAKASGRIIFALPPLR